MLGELLKEQYEAEFEEYSSRVFKVKYEMRGNHSLLTL